MAKHISRTGRVVAAGAARIYRQGAHRQNAGVLTYRTADGSEIESDVPILGWLLAMNGGDGRAATGTGQLSFGFMSERVT
jgi:hypothetical protein